MVVTLQGDPGGSEEMIGGAFVGIFCTYFHTVSFLLNLPLRWSHSNQKFWKFLKHHCQEGINTTLSGLTIIFRRYAAKKVKDMLRKLIYLPIPRHHKVFPKSNLGIFSSRSLPGRVEQDQAGEERPALQASSQLYVTFSIDEDYTRVFKVIQDNH